MTSRGSFLKNLLLLLGVLLAINAHAQKNEEKEVYECFKRYKSLILQSKGEEAFELIDSNTYRYFDNTLKASIYADKKEVEALPLIDRLSVLLVRHRIPADELLTMTGREYFIQSVKQGMFGKNSLAAIELGKTEVNGDSARAQIIRDLEDTDMWFRFFKENGDWKLDLTSIFAPTTLHLMTGLAKQGMSENEFIFAILESTGKPVTEEIWFPLKSNK